MYRNYLRTAIQSLKKNILFTIINTVGISVALAVVFLIILYVVNELSYNRCHENRDRVYRVLNYYTESKAMSEDTPYILASTLKDDFSQIEKATQTSGIGSLRLKFKDEYFDISNVIATGSEIFDIFTLPLVFGQANQNLLDDQKSIVISRKLAEKFFPGQDPVGRSIEGEIEYQPCVFTITGVLNDIPVNSTFRPSCLVNSKWSIDPVNQIFNITNADKKWDITSWQTWVLLKEGAQANDLNDQLKDFALKHIGNLTYATYSLQSLNDVYLKTGKLLNSGSDKIRDIRLLSIIAIVILIIATINYVLISTAVSTVRSKEIAIRKTFGASNRTVKRQLYLESILMALLALPIAISLAFIAIPGAEKLFQTRLLIIDSNLIVYSLIFLSITILIGFASGIYAAGYLSKLKVVSIFNHYVEFGKNKTAFRSLLIVSELVIFCVFVSSMFIVRSQYKYFLTKNPGYNTENTIMIELGFDSKGYTPYLNAIKSNPNVISAAGSLYGLPSRSSGALMIPNYRDKSINVKLEGMVVDYGFLEAMGIDLVEGRYFSRDFGNDMAKSVILNETAVKQLEISDPIGKLFDSLIIVGVVKDFMPYSFEQEITPQFIMLNTEYVFSIGVHYRPGTLNVLLPFLESEWKKVEPDRPFNYSTIEDITETIYASQKRLISIITFTTIFSLFISMSGLFGLTLFVLRSRTKEIGIRKILGSSENAIIYSALRENLLKVFFAAIISVPITYYIMNQWLSRYAYRITINGWFFVISLVFAIVVVVLTVIVLLYRIARTNPAISVRYE